MTLAVLVAFRWLPLAKAPCYLVALPVRFSVVVTSLVLPLPP
jgi:hypothetical protein